MLDPLLIYVGHSERDAAPATRAFEVAAFLGAGPKSKTPNDA